MSLISYVLTFAEGILTFISPCILPMLPIYFIYLAGTSGNGNDAVPQDRNRMILNSIGFVIGFTLVFVALGATVTSIGHFLVNNRVLLQKISGIVMIIFGLNFIGILKLGFLNSEKRIDYKFSRLRFLTSMVFGTVFGFGWTPCLGAFLGSALLLAGNSKTIIQGILFLLVYSIGLGIPFILTAVLFDRVKGALGQIQKHSRVISVISGILLVAAGILVFTDQLKYLN
jgi:cytochrome c-type biogenesis protein